MKPTQTLATSRRRFLKSSAAAFVGPMVVPSSVLGNDKTPAPSERINLACIGVGGMGTGNLNSFLGDERVQVVAICDVDENHRNRGLKTAKLKAGDGYGDFRKVLARKDVDAVMIATPDHWHSIITCAAANAGKDIYCEKPLAASIGEGRIVCETVKKNNRVLQCGTWRRSGRLTRRACELVRNGYIGELKKIEVGVPGKFAIRGGYTGLEKAQPVPKELDYEMWLGPAQKAEYTAGRVHFNFRWINEYAPGYITDWGAHFLDVAQWGNGTDETTPVEVSAYDLNSRATGYYDAPESFRVEYHYANGVSMTMVSTTDQKQWGIKFVGTKGYVFTENNTFRTGPAEIGRIKIKDSDTRLYESRNHHLNFIDCVKSRKRTAATAEASHRAATCCHLGTIAAATGRNLKFDPKTEQFETDASANKLLMRKMRAPWHLG